MALRDNTLTYEWAVSNCVEVLWSSGPMNIVLTFKRIYDKQRQLKTYRSLPSPLDIVLWDVP